jgi:hypothetical protein
VHRLVVGASMVVVTVVSGGREVVVVLLDVVVGRVVEVEVVVAVVGRVVVELVVVVELSTSIPGGTPSSFVTFSSKPGSGRAMAVSELMATTATSETNRAYSTNELPRSPCRRRGHRS